MFEKFMEGIFLGTVFGVSLVAFGIGVVSLVGKSTEMCM